MSRDCEILWFPSVTFGSSHHTNIPSTPLSASLGDVGVFTLNTPASPHVRICVAYRGSSSPQCSSLVLVMPSIVIGINLSILVAVTNALYPTRYRFSMSMSAAFIIALPLPYIVSNATSARWFCFGVSLCCIFNGKIQLPFCAIQPLLQLGVLSGIVHMQFHDGLAFQFPLVEQCARWLYHTFLRFIKKLRILSFHPQ